MNCDKSSLIACIYGECDAREREAFEQHLRGCAECRAEFEELRGVRKTLTEWTPPEAQLGFRVVRDVAPAAFDRTPARVLGWRQRLVTGAIPAWAKVAAAVILFAAGLGISNLHVTAGNGALTISTGWSPRPPSPAGYGETGKTAVAAVAPNGNGQPWKADIAALEQNLEQQIAAARSTSSPSNAGLAIPAKPSQAEAAQLIRTVQSMIEESERRQQQANEHMLATRLVQFGRDIESQRRADLLRVQQGLGQIEGRTTSEVAQLREVQRYLMRVANIQEIK